jgi:hypothetical protein
MGVFVGYPGRAAIVHPGSAPVGGGPPDYDHRPLEAWSERTDAVRIDADILAKLLAIAALIAATTEYAQVIKRRVVGRADAIERAIFEQRGLRGLVRVFLADARPTEAPSHDAVPS